jgi:phosphoribosylaminoimidazolecarboxamide formyltransferase/IMP cyclohydrolase
VRRAIISVWDKVGLDALAAGLIGMGVEIVATGGTAEALQRAGVSVVTVESITGYPAILDGRVKTLHPAIFAAILSRDDAAHRAQLDEMGISPVDLVVVNLYPFETRALDAPIAEAVELIDVGGISLIRAAAKNWERVAVVCDPSQYDAVVTELQHEGSLSGETRRRLAAEAFARTAAYDASIATYFNRQMHVQFPDLLTMAYRKVQQTRYGENPHQAAAFYRISTQRGGLPAARQLQGKELSFNNLVDLEAAWALVSEFAQPAAAILKHATPCGAAVAATIADAYVAARACDPVSAFGGIAAFNRDVDEPSARAVAGLFTEAVIAPSFSDTALAVFAKRPNLRVLECARASEDSAAGHLLPPLELRSVTGGLLVQEHDTVDLDETHLQVVTPRAPTPEEMADLRFAWRVCKWVKSNAIVLAHGEATVGIGSGQPNRVGAVEIAVKAAGDRARGTVLASDAFFPFRDGVDAAARAGVTAIIQPGGSVRDEEVIAAATERGMAMVLTGVRHFRH